MNRIKLYYQLTKPGIIKGNLLTFAGAFLFASGRSIDLWQLLLSTAGTGLVIGSACAINNVIDVRIDSKMERTKKRPLVTGAISKRSAVIFGLAIGIAGLSVLAAFINILTAWLGLAAFVSYVAIYGYVKRKSFYGTHVGTIPGAIPPVAGYAAAGGQLDIAALLLFLALVTWQMAHFYAIAIFRMKEYKAAGIPVLPIVKGTDKTRKQIVIFIILYIATVLFLGIGDHTGVVTTLANVLTGAYWLYKSLATWDRPLVPWAKSTFGYSLVILLVFSTALAANPWLP